MGRSASTPASSATSTNRRAMERLRTVLQPDQVRIPLKGLTNFLISFSQHSFNNFVKTVVIEDVFQWNFCFVFRRQRHGRIYQDHRRETIPQSHCKYHLEDFSIDLTRLSVSLSLSPILALSHSRSMSLTLILSISSFSITYKHYFSESIFLTFILFHSRNFFKILHCKCTVPSDLHTSGLTCQEDR